MNFFKSLNASDQEFGQQVLDIPEADMENLNELVHSCFTKEGILCAVKKLNNNKACGDDNILYEYIKNTQSKMIDLYEKIV